MILLFDITFVLELNLNIAIIVWILFLYIKKI